jgi:hypothetical protein
MKEPANSIRIESRKQTLSFSQIRRWPEFGVILAFLVLLAIFSIFSSNFLTLRNITGIRDCGYRCGFFNDCWRIRSFSE